ncbi:uncharacterized protein LOC126314411 [Schistocerca gregaria]|uniref:uncharacterized protein LOC126314411 n=1 Tax=Schistocerca gregaria TaxID=7010 RepID=UPI00211ECA53|nr:uncharacterized protein LOC126314411 [Schistocerca gregaria]
MAKLCQELAESYPDNHFAKAVLSLTYSSLGEESRAIELIESLLKDTMQWIGDSNALNYCTQSIKNLDRGDLLESIWATAAEKLPATEREAKVHALRQLFFSAIQSGSYARQMSAALDLCRLTKKEKYVMWSIVSRVQQALMPDRSGYTSVATTWGVEGKKSEDGDQNQAEERKERAVILHLAQKMFESKFLNSESATISSSEASFYLRLLVQQEQYQEALNFLRTETGKKAYALEHQRLNEEAALLSASGQHSSSKQLYSRLLTEHSSDEWTYAIGYLKSASEIKMNQIPNEVQAIEKWGWTRPTTTCWNQTINADENIDTCPTTEIPANEDLSNAALSISAKSNQTDLLKYLSPLHLSLIDAVRFIVSLQKKTAELPNKPRGPFLMHLEWEKECLPLIYQTKKDCMNHLIDLIHDMPEIKSSTLSIFENTDMKSSSSIPHDPSSFFNTFPFLSPSSPHPHHPIHLFSKHFDPRFPIHPLTLLTYFVNFSRKPTCYRDLLPYLPLLHPGFHLAFLLLLAQSTFPVIQNSKPTWQLVHFEAITRLLSSHFSTDLQLCLNRSISLQLGLNCPSDPKSTQDSALPSLLSLRISRLSHLYSVSQPLHSISLRSSEHFFGDHLLILAVHHYLQLFLLTSRTEYLVLSILSLDHGLSISRNNFELRILLGQLYQRLGCVPSSFEHFSRLSFKNSQLESLAHLFLDSLARFAHPKPFKHTEKSLQLFYKENKDSLSYWVLEAYKRKSYHKVKELEQFGFRIALSKQRLFLSLENIILQLALEAHSIQDIKNLVKTYQKQKKSIHRDIKKHLAHHNPSQKTTILSSLSDNYDLNIGDPYPVVRQWIASTLLPCRHWLTSLWPTQPSHILKYQLSHSVLKFLYHVLTKLVDTDSILQPTSASHANTPRGKKPHPHPNKPPSELNSDSGAQPPKTTQTQPKLPKTVKQTNVVPDIAQLNLTPPSSPDLESSILSFKDVSTDCLHENRLSPLAFCLKFTSLTQLIASLPSSSHFHYFCRLTDQISYLLTSNATSLTSFERLLFQLAHSITNLTLIFCLFSHLFQRPDLDSPTEELLLSSLKDESAFILSALQQYDNLIERSKPILFNVNVPLVTAFLYVPLVLWQGTLPFLWKTVDRTPGPDGSKPGSTGGQSPLNLCLTSARAELSQVNSAVINTLKHIQTSLASEAKCMTHLDTNTILSMSTEHIRLNKEAVHTVLNQITKERQDNAYFICSVIKSKIAYLNSFYLS